MTNIRQKLFSVVFLLLSTNLYANLSQTSKKIQTEYSQREINCLVQNIYHESRGEPYKGQIAVAYVTLNRIASGKYPETICGTVFQKGQFSWTKEKRRSMKDKEGLESSKLAAIAVLSGFESDPTNGCLFFHEKRKPSGFRYPKHKRKQVLIGNHLFYSV